MLGNKLCSCLFTHPSFYQPIYVFFLSWDLLKHLINYYKVIFKHKISLLHYNFFMCISFNVYCNKKKLEIILLELLEHVIRKYKQLFKILFQTISKWQESLFTDLLLEKKWSCSFIHPYFYQPIYRVENKAKTDCPFSEMLHSRWLHLDSERRWCSWLWWLVERGTGKLSTCWRQQPCSADETWDFTSLQKSSYTPT